MTDRTTALAGAALLALGGLVVLALAGGQFVATPARASGFLAYLGLGGLAYRGGRSAYGPAGGLGALALTAFSLPVLVAASGAPLAVPLATLATAAVLMRCLLDPTLLRVLLAGALMTASALAARAAGQSLGRALIWLALYSSLLAGLRSLTAEPHEPRRRTLQAAAVAVGLAWAVAALLLVLCAPLAPSVASLDPTVGSTLDARWPGRAMVYGAAGLLLALALARPWHWQRRYGDGGWLLALVCLGVPPGWAARQQLGAAALATAVPFLAVLAGAWWEGGLAAWRRRVAGAAVVLCLVTALLPLGAAAIHRTRSAVGSVSARPGAVA